MQGESAVKSGFVSVLGRTNAGKSSLINALSGAKLALISHKQNATRRKVRAIVMHGQTQIIFTDTPGLHKATKKLNQMLVNSALESINDCDFILFVASVFDDLSEYENFLKMPRKAQHIVVLNKVDLAKNEQILAKMSEYARFNAEFIALLPFSCRKKSYQKALLDEIAKHMPCHAYFYEPDLLSPAAQKEFFRDFILEAIFEKFSAELPYSCEVLVNRVAEGDSLHIDAAVITDTPSHKAMLIGKDGRALVRLGAAARAKISRFADKKASLNLTVSVKKAWQNDNDFLKKVIF